MKTHSIASHAPSWKQTCSRLLAPAAALFCAAGIANAGTMSIPSKAPVTTTPTEGKFINFAATSITYLYGFNWDTPFSAAKERDIITLEHFNDNSIGDLFFFVDIANIATEGKGSPSAGVDFYGEIDPRLSFSKIFGKSCEYGIIKDWLFYSGTLELGSSGSLDNINQKFGTHIDTTHVAQLHGMGVDFKVPGIPVLNLNAYWRDDTDAHGSTWQLTAVWGAPFKIGNLDFIFKGFADFAGSEGNLEWQFHTSPQLMVDLGDKIFGKKGVFLFGTEVDIWVNEYGVKDQDDFVPQIIGQIVF